MAPSHKSIRRIFRDISAIVQDDTLKNVHIYVNDDDITTAKILIIGLQGTPYFGGYYLFDIKFPDNYPNSPPKVNFLSTDGTIRFNPNYYAEGKVCLSNINTWGDNDWSPTQTLLSVVIVLNSRFHDNPMTNEPSFERLKLTDTTAIHYNKYVTYHNFTYAVSHLLEYPICPEFHSIMINEFRKNYNKYIEVLEELINTHDCKSIISTHFNFNGTLDFNMALNKIKNMYDRLSNGEIKCNDNNVDIEINNLNYLQAKMSELNINIAIKKPDTMEVD